MIVGSPFELTFMTRARLAESPGEGHGQAGKTSYNRGSIVWPARWVGFGELTNVTKGDS